MNPKPKNEVMPDVEKQVMKTQLESQGLEATALNTVMNSPASRQAVFALLRNIARNAKKAT